MHVDVRFSLAIIPDWNMILSVGEWEETVAYLFKFYMSEVESIKLIIDTMLQGVLFQYPDQIETMHVKSLFLFQVASQTVFTPSIFIKSGVSLRIY